MPVHARPSDGTVVLRNWDAAMQDGPDDVIVRSVPYYSQHGPCGVDFGALERETVELAPGEVHLWLAFYDRSVVERQLSAWRRFLSRGERARERRFPRKSDRIRYLLTRALVRTILSRYAPVAPWDWKFATNPYGRPEIMAPGCRSAKLEFNISHTEGLIALGVSRCEHMGVDAEDVYAREAPLHVAKRFFDAEEVATLDAAPPEERQYRFFEYWTLKESYVKARGKGLYLPLDQFSFSYPDDRTVIFSAGSELDGEPDRWQFWQLYPARRWLVTVCVRRIPRRRSSLSVWLAAGGTLLGQVTATRTAAGR